MEKHSSIADALSQKNATEIKYTNKWGVTRYPSLDEIPASQIRYTNKWGVTRFPPLVRNRDLFLVPSL